MSDVSSEPQIEVQKDGRPGWWLRVNHKKPNFFGGPLKVILNVFAIFIVSQLVAALSVELVLAVIHPGQNLGGLLDKSAPAQFFYVALAETLAIWFVVALLRRRGLNLAAIGWGRWPRWRDLKWAAVGFVAFYTLLVVTSAVLSALFPEINNNQQQDVGFHTLNTTLDHMLAFGALVIFPPLGEETLVRGYLYSALRSKWRVLPAMLLTSFLFGIAHLQPGSNGALVWIAAVDTFILSLVLVYLRETTGALYAGVLVHALNNVIAFGVHFHG